MKTAVIIASDPNSRADEALGRFRNALSLAHESREQGDQVEIGFIGAGTRWPAVASALGHPANESYQRVRDLVKGVSRSCARVNGAEEAASQAGVGLVANSPTGGLSLRQYLADGWSVVLF